MRRSSLQPPTRVSSEYKIVSSFYCSKQNYVEIYRQGRLWWREVLEESENCIFGLTHNAFRRIDIVIVDEIVKYE